MQYTSCFFPPEGYDLVTCESLDSLLIIAVRLSAILNGHFDFELHYLGQKKRYINYDFL